MINPSITRRAASVLALIGALFASPVRAEACPSIDSWLELIRERGGQHRLLDAAELSRIEGVLGTQTKATRQRWTSAIVTAFPDGSGLVLLAFHTGVCGVVELAPDRWPEWRKMMTSRAI